VRQLLLSQSCGSQRTNIKTKWSHIPITFTTPDIKLDSFPHTYSMVLTVHMNKWDIIRVLVNNNNQDKILFLSTFDQMGCDRR
jgi:hypothetical protein